MNCQQDELYTAQSTLPHGMEFLTVEEVQEYVDRLREESWWSRFYPQVMRIEVGFIKGDMSVGGWRKEQSAGKIDLHPGGRNELVVIHEVAHVLAGARYGSRSHDPWYCRVFMELVFSVLGTDAYHHLHHRFHQCGVEHDPPRSEFEVGRARWIL